jgi:exosortase/archaeosortase family protein
LNFNFSNKRLFIYIAKFIGAFCILYFGTIAVEGLAAPEGKYYNSFIDKHLDYVSWLRSSLTHGTKLVVAAFGYPADFLSQTVLQVKGGRGINVGYDCLGYGVISFWIAFVFANTGSWKRKLIWILSGVVLLWLINVLRISLVLIGINKHWKFPFGWDHHTWFNIVAYVSIFAMIWLYDMGTRMKVKGEQNNKPAS